MGQEQVQGIVRDVPKDELHVHITDDDSGIIRDLTAIELLFYGPR